MTDPAPNPEEAKQLLGAARRAGVRTKERIGPGLDDLLLLTGAAIAGMLVSGAYYHSTSGRIAVLALLIGGRLSVAKSLRARVGLGRPLSRWNFAVAAMLFVADLVIGLVLTGSARDIALIASLGVASAVLGVALRAELFYWVAALVGVVVVIAYVAPDLSSLGSFALGLALAVITASLVRYRATR